MIDEANNLIVNGTVKSFLVRTMQGYNSDFDYTLPKKGLSYECGEILHVKNASDLNWWRAIKLNPIKIKFDQDDDGLIPSAERLLRKYTNKENTVNFEEKTTVIDPRGHQTIDKISVTIVKGSGSMDVQRKRQNAYMHFMNNRSDSKDKLCDFYEIVENVKVSFLRPVIIVGPGRSNLYDKLLELYPDKFASPVNHTTRAMRQSEVDGIDYHFIETKEDFLKDKEAGLFVETVEYNGNQYGTSLLAVRTVMESQRHCMIDATLEVIRNLEDKGIFPIAILVCPDSLKAAKELMGGTCNEKLIRTTLQYSVMINSKERQLFDVKLRCETMTELIAQTYTSVMNCQKWGVWRRSSDQCKLGHGSL